MPGDTVTIVQMCGVCKTEVGTFEVKKENMMLSTKSQTWCPQCQATTQEVRDVAGRHAAIQRDVDSLPWQQTSGTVEDAS